MTKNEIITQLFKGKSFNDCLNKMEPEYLRDELRSEVIAIVCEWSEERILGLHARKELDFFVAKVIINQIQSDKSPFYYKFRRHFEEFTDQDRIDETDLLIRQEDENQEEQLAEAAHAELGKCHWYDQGIVNLYLQDNSYRDIEKMTKIPYSSVFKTVKRTIKHIRCQISR